MTQLRQTAHIPVMLAEVLTIGRPGSNEIWVDGTAGGGGHSQAILNQLGPNGILLAIDRDPAAARRLAAKLVDQRVRVRCDSYEHIPEILAEIGNAKAHGILLDLGLSSDQLADAERGFSFAATGALDMRFDVNSGEPAWEWLNSASEHDIADVIYRYGEERYSRRIARQIVQVRQEEVIRTAVRLREIVLASLPRAQKHGQRLDPATRTFQALRIFINDELEIIQRALDRLPDCLAEGGRLVVISFHSLEDRLVKNCLRNNAQLEVITPKPVQPTDAETAHNPRSRSAKLRAAIRGNGSRSVSKNKYAAFSKVRANT